MEISYYNIATMTEGLLRDESERYLPHSTLPYRPPQEL